MDMPRMFRVRQKFHAPVVTDIASEVCREYDRLGLAGLFDGKKVGITVGSRGISDILPILKALVRRIKEDGGDVVLLAAMGSHGGGTAEGQSGVLQSLGITEEALSAPVVTCARGVEVGCVCDLAAFTLESALAVDAIILLNRVKVHTAFHGEVESGLMKMLVVGLGGPQGAAQFHSRGSLELPGLLLDVGRLLLDTLPVVAGFAIAENAHEKTARIKGFWANDIPAEEPKFLEFTRTLMPHLPAERLDALVIEEMGKNYSGTGVDTNIIGRLRLEDVPEPDLPSVRRVAVLDLSEESHGNANGLGLVDLTTERLVNKIDRQATYLNCVTTGFLTRGAIPVYAKDENELMEMLLKSLGGIAPEEIRLVQIPNTLHLTECLVSEPLVKELDESVTEVIGDCGPISFDAAGNITVRVGGH